MEVSVKLSDRLMTVAGFVTKGLKVADIGTDHGYVPIYLVQNGVCPSAIAADINEGPVQRASKHITENGLENYIETRISDGFEKIGVGETECGIIAGMGGELMIHILDQGHDKVQALKELILSPHSEIFLVRKYLHSINYKIIDEKMLIDEGKYYTVIKAIHGRDCEYNESEYRYGKILIDRKDDILKSFILKEMDKIIEITDNLRKSSTNNAVIRLNELEEEYKKLKNVMRGMEE